MDTKKTEERIKALNTADDDRTASLVNQADMDYHHNPGRVSSRSARMALISAALYTTGPAAVMVPPLAGSVASTEKKDQNYLKLRKKRF